MVLFKEVYPVYVGVEKCSRDLSEYAFVILTGTLKIVADKEGRQRAIEKMTEFGSAKLSTTFLCAHGSKVRMLGRFKS